MGEQLTEETLGLRNSLVDIIGGEGGSRALGLLANVRKSLWVAKVQWKILLNYKLSFILQIIDIVFNVLIYFFVGFLVSPSKLSELGYGTDYAAFAITGIALSRYIWISLTRITRRMQYEIDAGTLESIVVSGATMKIWVIGQSIFGFLWSSVWFIGTILSAILIGVHFYLSLFNLLEVLLIIILTVLAHVSIGIIFAALAIFHKQIDSVVLVVSFIMEFLGGVTYPLQLLSRIPGLYFLSQFVPFTHGIELLRKVMLVNTSMFDPELIYHTLVLLAYIPLIFLAFRVLDYYFEKARRLGELGSY